MATNDAWETWSGRFAIIFTLRRQNRCVNPLGTPELPGDGPVLLKNQVATPEQSHIVELQPLEFKLAHRDFELI